MPTTSARVFIERALGVPASVKRPDDATVARLRQLGKQTNGAAMGTPSPLDPGSQQQMITLIRERLILALGAGEIDEVLSGSVDDWTDHAVRFVNRHGIASAISEECEPSAIAVVGGAFRALHDYAESHPNMAID